MKDHDFKVGDKVNIFDDGLIRFSNRVIEAIDHNVLHIEGLEFSVHCDDVRKIVNMQEDVIVKTQYIVIAEHKRKDFEEKVSKKLNQGWTPIGGVSNDGSDDEYLQAMAISQ